MLLFYLGLLQAVAAGVCVCVCLNYPWGSTLRSLIAERGQNRRRGCRAWLSGLLPVSSLSQVLQQVPRWARKAWTGLSYCTAPLLVFNYFHLTVLHPGLPGPKAIAGCAAVQNAWCIVATASPCSLSRVSHLLRLVAPAHCDPRR